MTNDEAEIRGAIAAWMRATQAGELNTVLDLMADDALFLLPGRPPMNKAAFADAQRAIAGFEFSIDYEIQEIVVSGDLAYCWNRLSVAVSMMDQGEPHRRAGSVLSVFRREGGRWLLIRDANQLSDLKD